MLRQVLIRIGVGLGTLVAVSALLFFSINALPGDSATAILGQQATPQSLALLRHKLGLDRPSGVRYVEWLKGFATGDLGVSPLSGGSVSALISPLVAHTALLALATLSLLVPFAVLFGALSAVFRDRFFDHATAATTLLLISLPEFVTGNVLVLFLAIKLRLLPSVSIFDTSLSPLSQLPILVLPAVTLLVASLAQTTRMVRATLLDVLSSDFVQMARLKGVPESAVILRHALPNALGPVIQVVVLNIAWLLGGVVIVEVVFQYPGIGAALASAIDNRDLPTTQAIGMIITSSFIILNLLGDVIVILTNPRLRTST